MKTLLFCLLALFVGYGCMAAKHSHENESSEPLFKFDLPDITPTEPKDEKPAPKKNTPEKKPSKPVPFQNQDGKTFYI